MARQGRRGFRGGGAVLCKAAASGTWSRIIASRRLRSVSARLRTPRGVRQDEEGEILHLVTLWRSTKEEIRMKKTRKSTQPVSADAIARLADQGKDVSRFFKGQGRMIQPIQRVNVDVTATMLEELDKAAQDLNVSRQAVIKTLVRQALDQHYLAQRARRPQAAS
jgi:hypothetical protein